MDVEVGPSSYVDDLYDSNEEKVKTLPNIFISVTFECFVRSLLLF